MSDFKPMAAEYLQTVRQLDPVRSTQLGITDYDHLLTDLSPEGQAHALNAYQSLLTRFETVKEAELSAPDRIDLCIIKADLTNRIYEQGLNAPGRAPYLYGETLGQALSAIMDRDFQPVSERAERLLERLRLIPMFLTAARQNLRIAAIPRMWNRLGQITTRGLVMFLQNAVADFAAPAPLAVSIAEATREALQAVEGYGQWLREIETQCTGDFQIGSDCFNQRLQTLFMVEMDAQQLHEFGREQVDQAERELSAVARSIDPTRSWQEIAEAIKDHHPTAEQLLPSYAHEVTLAEDFVRQHQLVSIPEGAECTVSSTPEYLRATTPLGDMATTAPFSPGLKSTLRITPIDRQAPAAQQREHLRDNNYAFQRAIALHEAYPGHHLQLVRHKLFPSEVRKNFMTPLFVEGWGLYTEQMMQETGFLNTPQLHLMQLKNVLWRAVRVVLDTGLHTQGLAYEDALQMMMTKVRMEGHMAQGEVSRYTTHNNATYTSSYLLGKSLIIELRQAYQRKMGDAFTLREFHDRLLSYGSIPVPLVAKELMG